MLQKAPRHFSEILEVIQKTPIGKKTLAAVQQKIGSGVLRIESYPLELLERLREVTELDTPIGACLINDAETGVIYFDPTASVSVLAAFVFHELVHAGDERIWARAREVKGPVFEFRMSTEMHAFEQQHRFVQELEAALPGYLDSLRQAYPQARVLHERLSELDIQALYSTQDSEDSDAA